jgi:hypothetical protein
VEFSTGSGSDRVADQHAISLLDLYSDD